MSLTLDQKLELCRRKLTLSGAEIKTTNECGRNARTDPSKRNYFLGLFRILDKTYEKFSKDWDTLLELYMLSKAEPSQDDRHLHQTVYNNYTEANSSYIEITQAQSVQGANPSPVNSSASLNESRTVRARLPQINLPQFDGTIIDWPLFRDTFISLIHNEPTISNMEKYHFLISSLKGSALSLIKGIPLQEINYERAWSVLLTNYNNKRVLAQSYLNALLEYKPHTQKPSLVTLKAFIINVCEKVEAFKLLNIPDAGDFILFTLALRCLDPYTRKEFERENLGVSYPKFEDLLQYVRDECLSLELSNEHTEPTRPSSVIKSTTNQAKGKGYRTSLLAGGTRRGASRRGRQVEFKPCPVCNQSHSLYRCYKFRRATNPEKNALLQNWQGCKNCLAGNHTVQNCTSPTSCRHCKQRHHSWLHISSEIPSGIASAPSANVGPSSSKDDPTVHCGVSLSSEGNKISREVLLGTAIAQIQSRTGDYLPIRAVIDCGSQYSFVTAECAKKLGLEVTPFLTPISGIGQTALKESLGHVKCNIRSNQQKPPILTTSAVVVDSITNELPHSELDDECVQLFSTFRLADPQFWKPGPVEFLLGADLYYDVIKGAPFKIQEDTPHLTNSIFGYIIAGPCRKGQTQGPKGRVFFLNQRDDLLDSMKRFWELEEVDNNKMKSSPEDLYCEDHFNQTHYRDQSGRYVIRLPFKDNCHTGLEASKGQALTRFYSLESKLSKNPSFRHEYNNFMNDYIELGHMRIAVEDGAYYIPHHGVFKKEGEKTKIRVVFDASASTPNGSLNDQLYIGPKLQNDICDILLNFRQHPVALTTDMVKMYRQILLHPEDRKYHHIFWRSDPSQPLQRYELLTVTYGVSSSPFLALRVMKQLVVDEGSAYPLASRALSTDIYVDDIVTGAQDIDSARILQRELIDILAKAGISLSKWASNLKELIPGQQTALDLDSASSTKKILGLQWDPNRDVFIFFIDLPLCIFTKRLVLSYIARIYDPLGFLSPVIFYTKCILQTLWQRNVSWDERIPRDIEDKWTSCFNQLHLLSEVAIPRHIHIEASKQCHIIGFSDASQRGYSAVLYLRVCHEDGIASYLLKSKTKLAPIKPTSIPRLELCGALLLARLYASVRGFLQVLPIIGSYWFTDSMIVLGWLNTEPHLLKLFVANRVVEILEATEVSDWYHIRSNDNSADCASRGILPKDLLDHSIWWSGPSWITAEQNYWPLTTYSIQTGVEIPETRPEYGTALLEREATTTSMLIPLMEKYSSYGRLLRVICYVRRFIYRLRNKEPSTLGPIRVAELTEANHICIKAVQTTYFANEFSSSGSGPRSVILKKLNVFHDSNGIIRVGGRLSNSSLPYYTKHPILLPKCHFTKILIDYYHRSYLHLGPSALQAMIQTMYWILSARTIIRQRVHLCSVCYKAHQRPKEPFMGDLPSSRFAEGKAFQHTGVDYAGPFAIRDSLRRKATISKAYLALFICMSTKAVHLELVSSCSTESFLAAFDRFIGRRGVPLHMYSDCGTNFIGAANKLREIYSWQRNNETQEEILQHCSPLGIEWSFNPPFAPHFGGIWEAGIKSTKTLLRKILTETPLTFEELATVFTRIEAILNSRPICPLGSDPEEVECLTPGHFLVGCPLTARPEYTKLHLQENRLTRWELVQQRVQHYWRRWRKEYLHELQQRPKWLTKRSSINVGDLVIIDDPQANPMHWPMARVTAVHPGKDGIVRVVTLRTSKGTIKRPVAKIISLKDITNPSQ